MRRLSESARIAPSSGVWRGTASSRRRRTSRHTSSSPSCVDGVGSVARHLVACGLVVEQVGERGGVPSGASPLCVSGGLWVMGYVLCLTHNLYPPSRFLSLFFTLRVALRRAPRLVPRLVGVGGFTPSVWHCEAVREAVSPQSVARTATAGRRGQSAVSPSMAGIGEPW